MLRVLKTRQLSQKDKNSDVLIERNRIPFYRRGAGHGSANQLLNMLDYLFSATYIFKGADFSLYAVEEDNNLWGRLKYPSAKTH